LTSKYVFCDPLLFVRDEEVFIALTFNILEIKSQNKLAIGVDLGCVNLAATSEGKLYKCSSFNARKRKLRRLKSSLKSKRTKSARRHLNKLNRKERK
jgi:transposase